MLTVNPAAGRGFPVAAERGRIETAPSATSTASVSRFPWLRSRGRIETGGPADFRERPCVSPGCGAGGGLKLVTCLAYARYFGTFPLAAEPRAILFRYKGQVI